MNEARFKYTVHRIPIRKAKAKITLQVKHPEDVARLTGIAYTTNAKVGGGDFGIPMQPTLGYLSVAIADKGDVIYTSAVHGDNGLVLNMLGVPIAWTSFLSGFFTTEGTQRAQYFNTSVDAKSTLLEVFYRDIIINAPPGGSGNPYYYVTLYLRYERE